MRVILVPVNERADLIYLALVARRVGAENLKEGE
jgi:hypothetical protein